jgi:hypothetical protein
VQMEAHGVVQMPGFGSSTLARGDAERLLRRLLLMGVLEEVTSRQGAYQSVVALVRAAQV